ncbi:MAG TPA: methylmalonyl-CoA epimerase [Pseudogracilibacillus sp.]|nr:methylmalonyl-CoA epimerase [Pseudogracilibacillus sp.]
MEQEKKKQPIKKIAHIGIAVHSLDEALPFYRDHLGLTLEKIETVTSEKVRVAFLSVGESTIELIEPIDETSTVYSFLQKRGEGIHHLALQTDDIRKQLASLKERDVKLVHEEPVRGALQTEIAFIHPKAGNNVLIELVERQKEDDH